MKSYILWHRKSHLRRDFQTQDSKISRLAQNLKKQFLEVFPQYFLHVVHWCTHVYNNYLYMRDTAECFVSQKHNVIFTKEQRMI